MHRFFRSTALECLAVLDDNEIPYDIIMNIDKVNAHQKQRDCELQLRALASTTQSPIMEKVATLFHINPAATIHIINYFNFFIELIIVL
jgi:hypothetical protein